METSLNLNQVAAFVERSVLLQRNANQNGHLTSIPWLSGSPGIGKSEIIRQVCKERGWGLKVVYMATVMLEQITGLPKIGKDEDMKTEFILWSRPEIFNFNHLEVVPRSHQDPVILFLDDAHLCNRQIQAYMFQLLTYKSIHDHRLPQNVTIILAGNRGNDKAGFQEILAPVANRIFFIDLHADIDQWVEDYAIRNGIRADIITFLQNYPEFLIGKPIESGAWPSPRSWTYASIAMDSFGNSLTEQAMFTILSGHVGTEATTRFIEYYELYAKWDAQEILTNHAPMHTGNLSKVESYAMLSSCVTYLLKKLRENRFKLNGSIEGLITRFGAIVAKMIRYHKEILPLGLKLLLLGEKAETGKTTVIEKLASDRKIVQELFDIV